jgi:hypothetical protein
MHRLTRWLLQHKLSVLVFWRVNAVPDAKEAANTTHWLVPLGPEFERLAETLPAALGQVQPAGPPVRRMRAPLQQAVVLQVIDEGRRSSRPARLG